MTGTAQANAPSPKDACKDGGHANYVDPATGQPFADQGACVTHVNEVGTLTPVPPPRNPALTAVELTDGQVGTFYTVHIIATDLEPFASVEIHTTYRDGRTSVATGLQADETGRYGIVFGGDCRDTAVLAGEIILVAGEDRLVAPVPEITQCPVA
jgi:hypothetical protein